MAFNGTLAPSQAPSLSVKVMRILRLPWLDRTIAAVACVPMGAVAWYRYLHWHHGFPLIASAINTLILVVSMVIRRPPKRVTPNPWYWLLTFVATYWLFLVLTLLQEGKPVIANWITDSIATTGLLIVIWARLSLGRNIGFVPAQRELVTGGAYAYIRHPVYTGILFTHIAFALRAYSPLNLVLMSLGVFWMIPLKCLAEESFLSSDPQYAAYTKRVKARWIPFVI